MEVRRPLLTAEEVAGLLGGWPRTVEQVLRDELLEAGRRGRGPGLDRGAGLAAGTERRAGSARALRRLIAEALYGAADAICPPGAR